MSTLETLKRFGLKVEPLADAKSICVKPSKLLTDNIRRWIRDHKSEILRELYGVEQEADPPPIQKRKVWLITVSNKKITYIDPEGCSIDEIQRQLTDRFGKDFTRVEPKNIGK